MSATESLTQAGADVAPPEDVTAETAQQEEAAPEATETVAEGDAVTETQDEPGNDGDSDAGAEDEPEGNTEGEDDGDDGEGNGDEAEGSAEDAVPGVHPDSVTALQEILAERGVLTEAELEVLGEAAEAQEDATKASENATAALGEAIEAIERVQQGEGEGTPDGEPEASAPAASAPVPAGFTHEGHKSFGMRPTQRKVQPSLVTGRAYVIAGINPPAQWKHNGAMVRLMHCGTDMGWKLGQAVDFTQAKVKAWIGTYRVIGIAQDGVLLEGSKLGYRGNDGNVHVLDWNAKTTLWLCLPDGVTEFDKDNLPVRQPAAVQPAPQPAAEAPAAEGSTEGSTEAPAEAQPEANGTPPAAPQPQDSRAGSPRRDKNKGKNRGQDQNQNQNRLRSGFEGMGKPA